MTVIYNAKPSPVAKETGVSPLKNTQLKLLEKKKLPVPFPEHVSALTSISSPSHLLQYSAWLRGCMAVFFDQILVWKWKGTYSVPLITSVGSNVPSSRLIAALGQNLGNVLLWLMLFCNIDAFSVVRLLLRQSAVLLQILQIVTNNQQVIQWFNPQLAR